MRVGELRRTFVALDAPVIGSSYVRTFSIDHGRVRAEVSASQKAAFAQTATVMLPVRARDSVRVQDDGSKMSLEFILRDASDAPVRVSGGIAVYTDAVFGGDAVHRVTPEGVEDFVVFQSPGTREELVYDVDVSNAAGVRFVASTLELLDASGTPRLRVAPPVVFDAHGSRHSASMQIDGCSYDTNPAGPWGRPVTAPGASRCTLRVAWHDVEYPLIVDPQWTATGSMANARTFFAAVLLGNGKVLVAGGASNGVSAELYDPSGNGTFGATGSMGTARQSLAGVLLGSGKVLVVGGSNTASAELYDSGTGQFTPTGSMANGRTDLTATVLSSGKVLVAGGTSSTTAELYDPQGGSFSSAGTMTVARTRHTATTVPTGVLLAGGTTSTASLSSAEIYDGTKFVATGSMKDGRGGHTAVMLSTGKVLVAGGLLNYNTGTVTSNAELYDPGSGTFTPTGGMGLTRWQFTMTTLPSGKAIAVGGGEQSDSGPINTTEIYDPSSGTFTASATFTNGRAGHTTTMLSSGKLLMAGGSAYGPVYADAQLLTIVPKGTACTASADCETPLQCVDGVCCDSACTGQCEACDVTGQLGTCSQVTGAPHGSRTSCGGGTTACDLTCTAASRTQCSFPAASTPCGSTCASAQETDSTCDGNGQCVVAPPRQCPGSLTCADTTVCRASCAADTDCVSGYMCSATKCVPKTGATCVDDTHSQPASGTAVACSPYKCDSTTGGCRTTCGSVNDCVSPNICDTSGQCVPYTNNSGGCDASPNPPAWGWFAGVLLAIAGVVRRGARRV